MDFAKMNLTELKAEAKSRKIKGFSTMKKADLIAALELTNQPEPVKSESMVDAIKGTIRNIKESRSNKGRKAGSNSIKIANKPWQTKDLSFRLQRGSETAKLTARQARRLRKDQRKAGTVELTYV